MNAWMESHSEELLVNSISNIPFLLFEIVIISIILPFAIEYLRSVRSRKTRAMALSDIFALFLETTVLLPNRLSRIRRDPWDDTLLKQSVAAIRSVRSNVADKLPVLVSVLDPDSMSIVFLASRALDQWFGRFEDIAAIEDSIEPKDVDRLRGMAVQVELALMSLDRRAAALNRHTSNPYPEQVQDFLYTAIKELQLLMEDQGISDENIHRAKARRRYAFENIRSQSPAAKRKAADQE